MRGLSIRQPWASLIAGGFKVIETRSRRSHYRGPVLIHASQSFSKDERKIAERTLFRTTPWLEGMDPTDTLPLGQVVAVAELVDCVSSEWFVDLVRERKARAVEFTADDRRVIRVADPDMELALGNYQPGRFGWVLDNVQRLENPVAATGQLGMWHPPTDVLLPVLAQVKGVDMPAVQA